MGEMRSTDVSLCVFSVYFVFSPLSAEGKHLNQEVIGHGLCWSRLTSWVIRLISCSPDKRQRGHSITCVVSLSQMHNLNLTLRKHGTNPTEGLPTKMLDEYSSKCQSSPRKTEGLSEIGETRRDQITKCDVGYWNRKWKFVGKLVNFMLGLQSS